MSQETQIEPLLTVEDLGEIKPNSVLAIYSRISLDLRMKLAQKLTSDLKQQGKGAVLLLFMQPGDDVRMLDDKEMAKNGWVRQSPGP